MRWYSLFLLISLLSGCSEPPKPQKQLKISYINDPLTLDSRKSGDFVSSNLLFFLFSGLVEYEPNGAIVPAVAQSYEILNDGTTYLFHLKKSFWSDGYPVTAQDFERAWKSSLDPSFPCLCPNLLYPLKNGEAAHKGLCSTEEVGVKAIDPYTLRVDLERPTPYFLSLISFCNFFPIPFHIEKQDPNHLVSNGPFSLKKWSQNSEILLEKNSRYWNAREIKFDSIHISIVKESLTALKMFENRELDFLGTPTSPLPSFEAIPPSFQKKFLKSQPIGGTCFLSFNLDFLPFKSLSMRKAFSCAINRQEIVDHITQHREPVANRCIAPIIMQNEDRQLIEQYNPLLAKAYFEQGLKELNLKREGFHLTLTYRKDGFIEKIAQTLQVEWQKLFQIPVDLQQLDEKVYFDYLYKREYQFALSRWIVQYNDPMNIFERFTLKSHPKNYPGFDDPTFVALVELSNQLVDPITRKEALEAAESYLLQQLPFTPIYHLVYTYLVQPYLKDCFMGSVGELYLHKADFQEKDSL